MKHFLIVIFFLFNGSTINAQKVDMKFIKSAVEARFNLSLDTLNYCDTYILNGIVFNKEDFVVALKAYNEFEIKITAIVNIKNSILYHQKCHYMILVGAGDYHQSRNKKIEELNLIQKNLNNNLPDLVIKDYLCKLCKQVIVDGIPVEMFKAKSLVNDIRPKDIDFIISYDSANPTIYGRNSIIGLTEIFLKKKKSRKYQY